MLPAGYRPRYGDIQFTLAGESYVLRYGIEAWDSLKSAFGVVDELDVVRKAFQKENVHAFLKAGFLWWHPEVDAQKIRELNDELPQPGERTLQAVALEALVAAAPELKKVLGLEGGSDPKEAPPQPERKPTRTRSAKRR